MKFVGSKILLCHYLCKKSILLGFTKLNFYKIMPYLWGESLEYPANLGEGLRDVAIIWVDPMRPLLFQLDG